MPLGSLDFRDEGTEIAAVFALLEEVSVEGRARNHRAFVDGFIPGGVISS